MLFGAIIYALLLTLVIRPYWRMLRAQAHRGGGRLQFTIADCWGVSVGLGATAFLTACAIEHVRDKYVVDGIQHVAATAIFFGASQLAGAVIVLSTSLSPARGKVAGHDSSSAWLVAFGTIIGLLMPVMGPVLLIIQKNEEQNAREPRWDWKTRKRRRYQQKRWGGGYSV
jgi:hypothetical protein